jgi:DNA-binding SARP family transcriptional activator
MIKLRAFGDPTLYGEGGARLGSLARQPKRFGLLIYLACDDRPHPHRRDELIATFWPESDTNRGRNALRQALHVIREQIGQDAVAGDGSQELWLSQDHFQSDVRSFVQSITEGDPASALSLYRADFLNGFYLNDSPEFGFWTEQRRTQLKDMAVRAAQDLAHRAEGERDLHEALFWWRRASTLSPYNEAFIRRIALLLAGSGNVGEAGAELEAFRNRLESELGLSLSLDTLELIRKVSGGLIEESAMWIGDRRREVPTTPSSRWKRPTDQQGS